jgi:hypothetical protein
MGPRANDGNPDVIISGLSKCKFVFYSSGSGTKVVCRSLAPALASCDKRKMFLKVAHVLAITLMLCRPVVPGSDELQNEYDVDSRSYLDLEEGNPFSPEEEEVRRLTGITYVRTQIQLQRAIVNDAVISFASDIYLTRAIIIYRVKGVTINGNLFKLSGRSKVRCFYVGNFRENYGVDNLLNHTHTTTVTINELLLHEGFDTYGGGGVQVYGQHVVLLNYCVIYDCYAGFSGGAINMRYGANVTLTGCTLYDNTAGVYGTVDNPSGLREGEGTAA